MLTSAASIPGSEQSKQFSFEEQNKAHFPGFNSGHLELLKLMLLFLPQTEMLFCIISELFLPVCYCIWDMMYQNKDILCNTGQVGTLAVNHWSYSGVPVIY